MDAPCASGVGERHKGGLFYCPMLRERDEDTGRWLENEPTTLEGQLAWRVCTGTPSLWLTRQLVTSMGSSETLKGLDVTGALALAREYRPGLNARLFIACCQGIERGRFKAETEKARGDDAPQE